MRREKPDLTAQVVRAHSLALGREPGAAARDKLIAFTEANGLPSLCRVLLNLNEFNFAD